MCNSMEMSRVQYLRTFVNERLTAAAEEILGAFEKTIVVYEEEIDRQRRMLNLVLKPEIKLHRADPPQPHVSEEAPRDQERNSSLGQEIKEEQEEPCTSPEGEQLLVQEEADILKFTVTSTCKGSDHSADKFLNPDPNQTVENVAEKDPLANISFKWIKSEADIEGSGVSEPHNDNHLLSHNCLVTESQDNKTDRCGNHENAGSTLSTETKQCDELCKCNSCSKEKNVKKHKKRSFGCGTCGKMFAQIDSVKKHMRIHTGEKSHTCIHCRKEFSSSSTLSKHLLIHTGEKPYKCLVCGHRFRISSTLKVHARLHTGEKPYKCSTCGKAFPRSTALKEHIRTHTGERPYRCSFCGDGFNNSSNLKKHVTKHTIVASGHSGAVVVLS